MKNDFKKEKDIWFATKKLPGILLCKIVIYWCDYFLQSQLPKYLLYLKFTPALILENVNLMKIVFCFFTLCYPLVSMGQTLNQAKNALKEINSLDQLEQLKSQHPKWSIYYDKTMYSDSSLFPDIIHGNVGEVVLKQYNPDAPTFVCKIISEGEEELCKVNYIYLDASKHNKFQIDSIRTIILNKYKNGEDFGVLVKAFNEDGNITGELDWFSKGMMVEAFDEAVRNRKKDEIFTVDVDDMKWYYVVLKTHNNKLEKAKTAIMIKYTE